MKQNQLDLLKHRCTCSPKTWFKTGLHEQSATKDIWLCKKLQEVLKYETSLNNIFVYVHVAEHAAVTVVHLQQIPRGDEYYYMTEAIQAGIIGS